MWYSCAVCLELLTTSVLSGAAARGLQAVLDEPGTYFQGWNLAGINRAEAWAVPKTMHRAGLKQDRELEGRG